MQNNALAECLFSLEMASKRSETLNDGYNNYVFGFFNNIQQICRYI